MWEADIESGVPVVSAGSKSKKRRPDTASRGGGSKERPKAPKVNTSKRIVLVSVGVLLCAVSGVAIWMVLSEYYGFNYNMSINQFSGELQMEELDGEFITWSDDYRDLQSAKSMNLTRTLSEKLTAAFDEEGIVVDDVYITELSPTEPKSFTTTVPVINSRSSHSSQSSMEDSTAGYTMGQILALQVETIEHDAVSFVSSIFTTVGVPSKNTAVFATSNGTWPKVSRMVQARMASHGMRIKMGNLKPQTSFMNSVQKAVQGNPTLMSDVPAANPPSGSPCDCHYNGYRVIGRGTLCQCDSSCAAPGTGIFGGTNDEFAAYSPICTAAFYAGFTKSNGGMVEVVILGQGEALAGEPKNGVNSFKLPFRSKTYLLKRVGPVIQPPTSSPAVVTQTRDIMFTIHVRYQSLDGQPAYFHPDMANLKSSLSLRITSKVSPKIRSAVEKQGFRVNSIEVIQIIQPKGQSGVFFGVDVKGNEYPNVQRAVSLESAEPSSLPRKISQSLTDGAEVRSFRYAKEFLEKMTNKM